VWRRTGAWRGWHHGEGRTQCGGGRSAAGLMPGAQPGWGSSHGWSDAVTSAGSDASTGTSDAKRLQASELRPDAGLGPDVRALALPHKKCCSIVLHTSPLFMLI